MYVDIVPNRSSPPAILLRESWRAEGKIKKRTIANISHWPMDQVLALRRVLKGETLIPVDEALVTERAVSHGHVEAVLGTLRGLDLENLLTSRRSRERDLVVAMIVEQILHHDSKLADTRLWHTTTLAEELGVEDADENDLYDALDWLLARQENIQKKLAKRHLHEGCSAFYDVTSSYYEGRTCPLAKRGHSRDKKEGKPIIVYGTLCERGGRPISVDVYPGNTGDSSTVTDQVQRLTEGIGLQQVVLVGDRGMITQVQIEELSEYPGLGWITALRSGAIGKLLQKGTLQPSLFDKRNLAEISSVEYPGERLVACYNPILAEERKRTRRELLEATELELSKIKRDVQRRTKKLLEKKEIALKVGKVLNKYKVAKHFELTIEDSLLEWSRREEKIKKEEQLDGIYVVRTSEPAERLSAEDAVRQYKNLSVVEAVYRAVKGLDILIRPIRHRTEDHVRAHIFLCMLAYYVEWHMKKALAPLLFVDEELERVRWSRDPVAKAEPSESAKRKKMLLRNEDGFPVHSFKTLLVELGTRQRVYYRLNEGGPETTFAQLTVPTRFQRKAFDLLGLGCTQ